MRRSVAALLFAVVTGCFAADTAKATPPAGALCVGDRVRLTAPTLDASPIVGFIVSADGEQLTVDVAHEGEAPAERSVEWDAVKRIERFTGYQSNTGRGAWTGLGVGVLIGTGSWYLMAQNSGEVVPPLTTPLWYGGLGALVGALVGSGGTHERWSKLPTDTRMGLQSGTPCAPIARDVSVGVLKVGDRVRLIAPTQTPSPVVGRLASASDSQLTVVVSEETRMAHAVERTIDRESLTRIERREDYRSKAGTGALIGGTLGIVAGVTLGYAAALSGDSRALFTAPLTFTAMGVVAGAAIGSAFNGERWRALPPDTRVGIRPGVGSEPFAVVIRTRF